MKELKIIIKSETLEQLKKILHQFNIRGLTVTTVLGCGNQKGERQVYRWEQSGEYKLLPKIEVCTVVADSCVQEVVDKICEEIGDNNFGDGKIFVYDVADVIRIRTRENGEMAL